MTRIAVLLVEGLTEEILYSILLEKLYGGKRVGYEELPKPLRELVEPLKKRATYYALENGCLVVLINCGGFDNIKSLLRMLLRREELKEAARELDLRLVIAADKDKRPLESLRGLLSSMSVASTLLNERVLMVELSPDTRLKIYVVEQGTSGEGATEEVEDELEKLIESARPELQSVARRIEEEIRTVLSSKQRFSIYLALLNPRIKARLLREYLRELLASIDADTLRRGLQNIARSLGEALT